MKCLKSTKAFMSHYLRNCFAPKISPIVSTPPPPTGYKYNIPVLRALWGNVPPPKRNGHEDRNMRIAPGTKKTNSTIIKTQ